VTVPGPGEDRELRDATALVYVTDLERPEIDASDAHHLLEVLRVTGDEPVAVSDGRGSYRMCSLVVDDAGLSRPGLPKSGPSRSGPSRSGPPRSGRPSRSRSRDAHLLPSGAIRTLVAPDVPVTIGFGLPKGDRAEWTIQKLTEIGVDVIVPLLTDRTVVRLDSAECARRGDRFRRVGREASAQSRRVHLPEILDPVRLTELPDAIASIATFAEPGGAPVESGISTVLVGPEGGWSTAELARGTRTVHFADHVLRAETAAIAAAVLLCALRSGIVASPGDRHS
jgi:16S rRNA (uracil1498-N3)-methyltransferase